MKKLIAAAVIAMSSVGCQYASANDFADDYCLETAMGMADFQTYFKVTGAPLWKAKNEFRHGFVEGAQGEEGVEHLMEMQLRFIEVTYQNLDMPQAELSKEVFFACKTFMEHM